MPMQNSFSAGLTKASDGHEVRGNCSGESYVWLVTLRCRSKMRRKGMALSSGFGDRALPKWSKVRKFDLFQEVLKWVAYMFRRDDFLLGGCSIFLPFPNFALTCCSLSELSSAWYWTVWNMNVFVFLNQGQLESRIHDSKSLANMMPIFIDAHDFPWSQRLCPSQLAFGGGALFYDIILVLGWSRPASFYWEPLTELRILRTWLQYGKLQLVDRIHVPNRH